MNIKLGDWVRSKVTGGCGRIVYIANIDGTIYYRIQDSNGDTHAVPIEKLSKVIEVE